jgi:hypothetical protein
LSCPDTIPAAQLGTDYQRYASAAVPNGKRATASWEYAVAPGVPTGHGLSPRWRRPGNGRMLHVPSPPPTVSRRRVLFGAAVLALLGATAAACGSSPPPPQVDELAAQLDRARADSQLATDAAAATPPPPTAQALTAVAAERSAHVQALTDELVRMVGKAAPTTTTTSTPAQPAKAPTTQDVIAALRQSADSAAQLAAKQSGYRAGLLGSIAASCTAAYTVALVPAGAPQ